MIEIEVNIIANEIISRTGEFYKTAIDVLKTRKSIDNENSPEILGAIGK